MNSLNFSELMDVQTTVELQRLTNIIMHRLNVPYYGFGQVRNYDVLPIKNIEKLGKLAHVPREWLDYFNDNPYWMKELFKKSVTEEQTFSLSRDLNVLPRKIVYGIRHQGINHGKIIPLPSKSGSSGVLVVFADNEKQLQAINFEEVIQLASFLQMLAETKFKTFFNPYETLNPKLLELVKLKNLDGLKNDEVAKQLGLTTATVRTNIQRLNEHLRVSKFSQAAWLLKNLGYFNPSMTMPSFAFAN